VIDGCGDSAAQDDAPPMEWIRQKAHAAGIAVPPKTQGPGKDGGAAS